MWRRLISGPSRKWRLRGLASLQKKQFSSSRIYCISVKGVTAGDYRRSRLIAIISFRVNTRLNWSLAYCYRPGFRLIMPIYRHYLPLTRIVALRGRSYFDIITYHTHDDTFILLSSSSNFMRAFIVTLAGLMIMTSLKYQAGKTIALYLISFSYASRWYLTTHYATQYACTVIAHKA